MVMGWYQIDENILSEFNDEPDVWQDVVTLVAIFTDMDYI